METVTLVTRRKHLLWVLYGLAAIYGIRGALLPADRLTSDYLLALATGLAVTFLVAVDAQLVGKPLPKTAFWVVLLLWPVAAPGCIIGLRKLDGVRFVVVHTVLLFAVFLAVGLVTVWLAA